MNEIIQQNVMTVDLEDYFCDLEVEKWKNYESRIEKTTQVLLDLFEKYDVTATFFTVGYIAEKFPELIKKIVNKGHEIGSHSYLHLDIRKVNSNEFESDLVKSINILESTSGKKILGFRAPFFSIEKKTFWAFDIIRKYLKYDSSVFPVKTPLYGIPDAPREIYNPSKNNPISKDSSEEFVEIPLSTNTIPLIGNIPIAGGFHLRFLPYWYIRSGIKKINKTAKPAVCYIHPKDLDPDMPRIPEYKWHYYYGLNGAIKKFEHLLQDFKFNSIRNVLEI